MEIYTLISIDCDLRIGNVYHRQKALEALMYLFEDYGMCGHITWFLNENDFKIVEWHATFLDKVIETGDSFGLHDHFDRMDSIHDYYPSATPVDINSYEEVYFLLERSKKIVENYIRSKGYNKPVILHRNGSLVQSVAIYRALKRLGYRVVSDITPQAYIDGSQYRDRIGRSHVMFNRGIPLGVQPYRHDVDNWTDYKSRKGYFIQIPVHYMGISLDSKYVDATVEACCRNELELCIFSWIFHPYEVQNVNGHIDKRKLKKLENNISRLIEKYNSKFNSFDEILEKLHL